MNTNSANVVVTTETPVGFRSYTRGTYASEASAVRAAKKRGPDAIVVAVPESRVSAAYWVVGHVD
jgi:methylmalonyl-CoA mutase cobalamin-binding subunit